MINGKQVAGVMRFVKILRADLQDLIANSKVDDSTVYQVTDAVGDTKRITVTGYADDTITQIGTNLTDNQVGIYDIDNDTFESLI